LCFEHQKEEETVSIFSPFSFLLSGSSFLLLSFFWFWLFEGMKKLLDLCVDFCSSNILMLHADFARLPEEIRQKILAHLHRFYKKKLVLPAVMKVLLVPGLRELVLDKIKPISDDCFDNGFPPTLR
jgi:hypothetical protein